MTQDWQETPEAKDSPTSQDRAPRLGLEGMRSMQGDGAGPADGEQPQLALDESQQVSLEELQGSPDLSKLEYRVGSPHADYEAYKGIQEAERQYELGQQASTMHLSSGAGAAEVAQALAEASATTAAAGNEAQDSGETAMDEYFLKKHGTAPYTDTASQ